MTFKPLELMVDRTEKFGEDSDQTFFTEMLYLGEFITKWTVAGFVACLDDDRESNRYRIEYNLVRADGIGEWSQSLDDMLSGPASQSLSNDFSEIRRNFTQRTTSGEWQHTAVSSLHEALCIVRNKHSPLPEKLAFRQWFTLFAELRNKTRGHGAVTLVKASKALQYLKKSISVVKKNNPIYRLPCAYLHRNLSGKYKVINFNHEIDEYRRLKTNKAMIYDNMQDGIYVYLDRFRRCNLIQSDSDATDFFFPNGNFNQASYELHSLLTDNRREGDSHRYHIPPSDRPSSETEGRLQLDVIGNVFSNMPGIPSGYVRRPKLEARTKEAFENDRHPIVTLVGRGGIGKTSLALRVLNELAFDDRFDVIVWFSARDIDLIEVGPKPVKPRVLTEKDIARQYCELTGDTSQELKPLDIITEHLRNNPHGSALYVFDNFETMRSPIDVFNWIDLNIRLPNKAVITSRFRDFKADYPIEVSGMERAEAEELVRQRVDELQLGDLIGIKEIEQIIDQSEGHPYVMRIMIGEIANNRKLSKPEKIIARKDEILNALFERTFANLSPIAARIFLMLSSWRSFVPQLAVEAVLIRHQDEDANPEAGIDELVRMSLVERISADDGSDFIGVPLAASFFGRKKLDTSPYAQRILSDVKFLQDIGPSNATGIKGNIGSRIEAFFRRTAERIGSQEVSYADVLPVLEFIAKGHNPAWLLLSEIEKEFGDADATQRASEYTRRFIEQAKEGEDVTSAWVMLTEMYKQMGDAVAGTNAFVRAAEVQPPPLYQVSQMANWLNNSSEAFEGLDVADRAVIFKPLAQLFEQHYQEATAADLSRLAWLHLHSGDDARAREVAYEGLNREPDNLHCSKLIKRLHS